MLSQLLTQAGIVHQVLNAKHHEREADIIAEAGCLGALTIATNMAGRGTDIVLGGSLQQRLAHADATEQASGVNGKKIMIGYWHWVGCMS